MQQFKAGDQVFVNGLISEYRRRNHKHFVTDNRGKHGVVAFTLQYGCEVKFDNCDKTIYFFHSEIYKFVELIK